jgi:hypothetical protein
MLNLLVRRVVAVLLVLQAYTLFGADHPVPPILDDKINDIFHFSSTPQIKAVLDSLSPPERVALLQYCREWIADPTQNPTADTIVLMELGDDATIAKVTEQYQKDPWNGRDLFAAVHPKVVQYAAPLLFRNERFEQIYDGDVGRVPLSFQTAMHIQRLLARSPYFSKDVNKWAESWGTGEDPRIRDMLRKWWAVNQGYFYSGNYVAVQPGESPPTVTTSSPTPKKPFVTQPSSASASTATPNPTTTPQAAASVAPTASSTPSTRLLLSVLALLAIATMGFLLFLRRKR